MESDHTQWIHSNQHRNLRTPKASCHRKAARHSYRQNRHPSARASAHARSAASSLGTAWGIWLTWLAGMRIYRSIVGFLGIHSVRSHTPHPSMYAWRSNNWVPWRSSLGRCSRPGQMCCRQPISVSSPCCRTLSRRNHAPPCATSSRPSSGVQWTRYSPPLRIPRSQLPRLARYMRRPWHRARRSS